MLPNDILNLIYHEALKDNWQILCYTIGVAGSGSSTTLQRLDEQNTRNSNYRCQEVGKQDQVSFVK